MKEKLKLDDRTDPYLPIILIVGAIVLMIVSPIIYIAQGSDSYIEVLFPVMLTLVGASFLVSGVIILGNNKTILGQERIEYQLIKINAKLEKKDINKKRD